MPSRDVPSMFGNPPRDRDTSVSGFVASKTGMHEVEAGPIIYEGTSSNFHEGYAIHELHQSPASLTLPELSS